jgi:hypothetical protein
MDIENNSKKRGNEDIHEKDIKHEKKKKQRKKRPPYELSIRPGQPHTITGDDGTSEKLVVLASGTQYEIGLKNNTNKRANAKVYVDGERVLYMRIDAKREHFFERPDTVAKKFTFYPLKLAEAAEADTSGMVEGGDDQMNATLVVTDSGALVQTKPLKGSGIARANDSLGEVRVEIIPEKIRAVTLRLMDYSPLGRDDVDMGTDKDYDNDMTATVLTTKTFHVNGYTLAREYQQGIAARLRKAIREAYDERTGPLNIRPEDFIHIRPLPIQDQEEKKHVNFFETSELQQYSLQRLGKAWRVVLPG